MGLLKQLMIFGQSGLQGLPTRVTLPLRAIQLRLSKGATGVPLFTTWDPVAGSGRAPIVGRPPGQRWILGRGLRVGGPGKQLFWRTLEEFCKGLGSVSLKSKHSTHTPITGGGSGRKDGNPLIDGRVCR